MKSISAARFKRPARRQFRDRIGVRPILRKKSEVSVVRLIGFFVGGVLLAQLMLMTSTMLRGPAAQPGSASGDLIRKRTAAPAVSEQVAAPLSASDLAIETTGQAPPDADRIEYAPAEMVRPPITLVCAEARDRLVDALTYYYLQRGRRPRASADEVTEAAAMTALLAGPADPSVTAEGNSCAG